MSSLNQLTREYLTDAQNGIAWLVLYKQGRSWHIDSRYIKYDADTDQFTDLAPDVIADLRRVLAVDPHAIIVNSYYDNLGPVDEMTWRTLADALRWQYESRYNQLADAIPEPREVSLDNGNTYMTASEAVAALYDPNSSFCGTWDTLVRAMDDEAREMAVSYARYPVDCDERGERVIFLACYLQVAPCDLIV